jgi:hypothetical protein
MALEDFEDITRTNVIARRNQLMGLWAGKQLGLSGNDLERYAVELHDADYEECGPRDVIRKVAGDLASSGIKVSSETVTKILWKAEAEARRELLSTD